MTTLTPLLYNDEFSEFQGTRWGSVRQNATSANGGLEEDSEICPQEGPQTEFLQTPADIAIYGGAAGGGKTWALLLEPLRHIEIPGFAAVFFRRTYPQISNTGGLWDESSKLYSHVDGAVPKVSDMRWNFRSGASVVFKHMQHENTKEEFQGAQIPLICFDELTHFSRGQFFYMLSRNRSLCGVTPYIRATCNPDPNSWVKEFLAPWLDDEFVQPNGQKYRLKSGQIAFFSQTDGNFTWHTYEQYMREQISLRPEDRTIKTLTFIAASVFDNKKLLAVNPQYLATLRALPLVEQERFLNGNWDISEAGNMFREEFFLDRRCSLSSLPRRWKRLIRFWDYASTNKSEMKRRGDDPDYTAGILLGLDDAGFYYIIDLVMAQDSPGAIEELVISTAHADVEKYGANYEVAWEEEPGSSGDYVTLHFRQKLQPLGFRCQGLGSTGSKVARAKPISTDCQNKLVWLVSGSWNKVFLQMATAFPSKDDKVHDDPVDALSGARAVMDLPPSGLVYAPITAVSSGWSGDPHTWYGGSFGGGRTARLSRPTPSLYERLMDESVRYGERSARETHSREREARRAQRAEAHFAKLMNSGGDDLPY